MNSENATAARARALVGTRFRPQGRSREHGLDCLGLVLLAGRLPVELVPADYSLRSRIADDVLALDLGGRAEPLPPAEARAGDVLLVEAMMGLHHFLVLVRGGYVHADARRGRVVLTPGAVPWPVVAAWRLREE